MLFRSPEPALADVPARRGRGPRDPDARSLDEVTREHVLRALARHQGNAAAAARQLGVSRTTLWRMLKRWGVSRRAVKGT